MAQRRTRSAALRSQPSALILTAHACPLRIVHAYGGRMQHRARDLTQVAAGSAQRRTAAQRTHPPPEAVGEAVSTRPSPHGHGQGVASSLHRYPSIRTRAWCLYPSPVTRLTAPSTSATTAAAAAAGRVGGARSTDQTLVAQLCSVCHTAECCAAARHSTRTASCVSAQRMG